MEHGAEFVSRDEYHDFRTDLRDDLRGFKKDIRRELLLMFMAAVPVGGFVSGAVQSKFGAYVTHSAVGHAVVSFVGSLV